MRCALCELCSMLSHLHKQNRISPGTYYFLHGSDDLCNGNTFSHRLMLLARTAEREFWFCFAKSRRRHIRNKGRRLCAHRTAVIAKLLMLSPSPHFSYYYWYATSASLVFPAAKAACGAHIKIITRHQTFNRILHGTRSFLARSPRRFIRFILFSNAACAFCAAHRFRWNYLDQIPERLGGFEQFVKHGVRAQWVNGVFPTLSYPSWTTLGTGSKTHFFN